MNDLLKKKDELKSLKNKYENKIFLIENELIKFEQELAKFSEDELVSTLKLSIQQQNIVEADKDNILVVACPGAGKTHTLISRYVHLILKQYIKPETILLITFTKKAGQEMLHRLENIVPTKLPYHVGSLHGLSYRILQKYYNINYTILDEMETRELLKQETNNILAESNLDYDIIVSIKNKIVNIIDQVSTTYPLNFKCILKKLNLSNHILIITQIYKSFIKRKKQENAIDFNDLMVQLCDFLKSPKSLDFKNNIKYIFFDEYQDINSIQNYILSMFKNISKIMAVGDDAQSIYSFRGSSVKYIHNFSNYFLPCNKYFLTENHRSTPAIVNFCQNIIEKNLNQYEKKVISIHSELGFKPEIHAFSISDKKELTNKEQQYKWIVQDIIRKVNNGISLSSMVILARTNKSLINIELELVINKVSFVKQLGSALLDKYHIKDFLAFIVIINNPKSSIHWKRIIGLHKGFNTIKANEITEGCTNIYDKIVMLSYNNQELNNLIILINNINNINKDIDKAKTILSYLETLWLNKHRFIDEYKNDVLSLLYYLRNDSLLEFINNLYLNQEVNCTYTNSIYLSTIHGSKGLEWEHVYLVDVNNNEFPNTQNSFYTNELETMEEERRLFYVACSRAKKYLTITYHTDLQINISPFIRELDTLLYFPNNVILNKISCENNIPRDITSILKNIGYINIAKLFENLNIKESIIHNKLDIPKHILDLKNKYIIGNYFEYLIPKIIQNNYPNKIKKILEKQKRVLFPNKILCEYIDENNHWNNLLETIFVMASFNTNIPNIELYKDYLINNHIFYKELEEGIKKLINILKPNCIQSNYNINVDLLKAKLDLVFDDIIIEIRVLSNEICCMQYLCQVFTYAFLMSKKGKKINKIILYNIEKGTLYTIDTTSFNFELLYQHLYIL